MERSQLFDLMSELTELPGPDVLRSSAEVVAYAGLNPRLHQSGTSIDRMTRISKIGNAVLRAAPPHPDILPLLEKNFSGPCPVHT